MGTTGGTTASRHRRGWTRRAEGPPGPAVSCVAQAGEPSTGSRRPEHHVVGLEGDGSGGRRPADLREHPLVGGVEREDQRLHERRRQAAVRGERLRSELRDTRGTGGGPAVAADLEAGCADLLEQHLWLITANVPARIVQRRPHGRVNRRRHEQDAAGTADPGDLIEKAGVIFDMLEDLEGEHCIERPVRERERSPCRHGATSSCGEPVEGVGRGIDEGGRRDRSGGSQPGSDLEDRTSPHPRREPVPDVGSDLHDAAGPAPVVRVIGVRPRRSAPLLGCLDLSHRPSVIVEAGSIPGDHGRARHGPNAVGRRCRSLWRRRTGIEPARELVALSSVLKTAGPTRNPDASTPEDSGAGSKGRCVQSPRDGAGAGDSSDTSP